ncbi:MAG: hypothetical protein JST26_14250 [Bacteroidetes bacterium]|nr:hypothetical protein [Bacteroidota bacterium]
MKTEKKKEKSSDFKVKLRIDHRTVITVTNENSLKSWKARYPAAIEID